MPETEICLNVPQRRLYTDIFLKNVSVKKHKMCKNKDNIAMFFLK